MSPLLSRIEIDLPIIQAPMAGVSTPEMAAAVSNAGGLGSVGVGSVDAEATRRMITAVRSRTDRPFNVNVFCNRPGGGVARPARPRVRPVRGEAAGPPDGDLPVLPD